MKKYFYLVSLLFGILSLQAQTNKTDRLQELEKSNTINQNQETTATLKSSSRLFKSKDDLTSVIMIVPSGSSVSVLESDSTYYKVVFEENEGYIFKRHAVIDKAPVNFSEYNQQKKPEQKEKPVQEKQISRFSYLENKYGTNMAARIYSGKIWKGMNSEMVKDSWGNADKVNRVINGNVIQEEWFYKSTWLYFENNSLVDWGPIRN